MKYVKPSLIYIDSYILSLKKLELEGFRDIFLAKDIENRKENYILDMELMESEKYKELIDFWAPSTTYWLVDEINKEFIGSVSIRHRLGNLTLERYVGHIGYDVSPKYRKKGFGKKLLVYGLEFTRKLGLKEILITCNQDNIASKKIIKKNKGIYIDSNYHNQLEKNILRYKIVL